ncbi:MAG: GIY-YIG nuclease family protein [Alphaproteobacteria bacterium]
MAAAERITPEADSLPAGAGAYALVIRLGRKLRPAIRTLAPATLGPGRYLYLGSANGPGGIRARVARHLRRDKKIHWHVDHLTTRGRVTHVIAAPGGSECALAARALSVDGVSVPMVGFGSSDCSLCPAHLLRLDGDMESVLQALEDEAGG